jgi:hypothetical protein
LLWAVFFGKDLALYLLSEVRVVLKISSISVILALFGFGFPFELEIPALAQRCSSPEAWRDLLDGVLPLPPVVEDGESRAA